MLTTQLLIHDLCDHDEDGTIRSTTSIFSLACFQFALDCLAMVSANLSAEPVASAANAAVAAIATSTQALEQGRGSAHRMAELFPGCSHFLRELQKTSETYCIAMLRAFSNSTPIDPCLDT